MHATNMRVILCKHIPGKSFEIQRRNSMTIILLKVKNNSSLSVIRTLCLSLRPLERISFEPPHKVAGVYYRVLRIVERITQEFAYP